MSTRGMVWSFICVMLIWGGNVEARSFSDQIDSFLGPSGIVLDVTPSDPAFNHTAHFTGATLSTLGLLVKQLAPSAADFPAISTAPGLTYQYDPETQAFLPTSTTLGPLFVERPQTLGRGRFALGFSYLFVDFDELDGQDMDRLSFTLHHSPSAVFGTETATVRFERFTLQSHVASFFATYGITDRWDVNFLLPVVFSSLKMRANARLNNVVTEITTEDGQVIEGPFHFFNEDEQIKEQTFSLSDDTFGVGDLRLRTKYHLLDSEVVNLSLGSALRIPTGDENNFQGLGDSTFTSFVTLAHEYGRFHLHASSGIEFNFDDSDRSRVRYAGGLTFQVIDQLALMVDVIGSSNLTTDRVWVNVPQFGGAPPSSSAGLIQAHHSPEDVALVPTGSTRISQTLSTHIIDLSVGLKFNFYESVVGYINFFVPVNTDGLRADLIPAAGLEMSF